jgi:hypothetical protein
MNATLGIDFMFDIDYLWVLFKRQKGQVCDDGYYFSASSIA